MVFARLLTSPMPRQSKNIDASEALSMPGVIGILTADDLPSVDAPNKPILTNEPNYVGEPILALAAENETLAQDALEKIRIDYEPLPFYSGPPAESLSGGPNARSEGNVVAEKPENR